MTDGQPCEAHITKARCEIALTPNLNLARWIHLVKALLPLQLKPMFWHNIADMLVLSTRN